MLTFDIKWKMSDHPRFAMKLSRSRQTAPSQQTIPEAITEKKSVVIQ